MTATQLQVADGDTHDTGRASLAEPGERGTTTIADRVVERVATHAVTDVERAAGAPRTVLGQSVGRVDEDTPARTSATVDGDLVTVSVSMSVAYPSPVREVAAQVRRRVIDRVQYITGLQVAEVDIDVPALGVRRPHQPRVR